MREIFDRYLLYNDHAASYTWKILGRPLDMDLNLEDNRVEDYADKLTCLKFTIICTSRLLILTLMTT